MNTGEVTWTWLYTDNWTVVESWLHETVCRQRPELWLTFDYIKLSSDRDLKWGPSLILI